MVARSASRHPTIQRLPSQSLFSRTPSLPRRLEPAPGAAQTGCLLPGLRPQLQHFSCSVPAGRTMCLLPGPITPARGLDPDCWNPKLRRPARRKASLAAQALLAQTRMLPRQGQDAAHFGHARCQRSRIFRKRPCRRAAVSRSKARQKRLVASGRISVSYMLGKTCAATASAAQVLRLHALKARTCQDQPPAVPAAPAGCQTPRTPCFLSTPFPAGATS